jgi:hypothetical protein
MPSRGVFQPLNRRKFTLIALNCPMGSLEPDNSDTFVLSPPPAEQSLEAHALLQRHRAALCQIEIAEKQRELIPSGPAIEFLAAVLKLLYRSIRAFPDLSVRAQDELCETIHEHILAHWIKAGWSLTPVEGAQARNGDQALARPTEWARRINGLVMEGLKKNHENESEAGELPGNVPRAGSHRRRHRKSDNSGD